MMNRSCFTCSIYLCMLYTGEEGTLTWNDNWITFMDTMLQISILTQPGRSLRLPTRIQSVRIDPSIHKEKIISTKSGKSSEFIIMDMTNQKNCIIL